MPTTTDTIDIKGLDKAAVLAALYNNAKVLGMGWLQYIPGDMTPEHATELVNDPHRRHTHPITH